MADMSVSVVIPAYNAAQTINRAVESVFNQTREAFEVLVIDDGSPDRDEIASALSKYGDRVTLIRKPNGGAASARNAGIEQARGDIIAFLDADDYWEPNKLELQLEILKKHPEVGLISSRWYEDYPDQSRIVTLLQSNIIYDRPWKLCGPDVFRVACYVLTPAIVLRRNHLGSQRFCQKLTTAEDRDLWCRMIAMAPIYISSVPLLTVVEKSGSLSRSNLDRDCENMLRVIHRHADLLGPKHIRLWESITYRRWAGEYLSVDQPSAALRPATQRLRRQPFSLEGWYVLGKCLARCCLR